jgi:hypothetical protein
MDRRHIRLKMAELQNTIKTMGGAGTPKSGPKEFSKTGRKKISNRTNL